MTHQQTARALFARFDQILGVRRQIRTLRQRPATPRPPRLEYRRPVTADPLFQGGDAGDTMLENAIKALLAKFPMRLSATCRPRPRPRSSTDRGARFTECSSRARLFRKSTVSRVSAVCDILSACYALCPAARPQVALVASIVFAPFSEGSAVSACYESSRCGHRHCHRHAVAGSTAGVRGACILHRQFKAQIALPAAFERTLTRRSTILCDPTRGSCSASLRPALAANASTCPCSAFVTTQWQRR